MLNGQFQIFPWVAICEITDPQVPPGPRFSPKPPETSAPYVAPREPWFPGRHCGWLGDERRMNDLTGVTRRGDGGRPGRTRAAPSRHVKSWHSVNNFRMFILFIRHAYAIAWRTHYLSRLPLPRLCCITSSPCA